MLSTYITSLFAALSFLPADKAPGSTEPTRFAADRPVDVRHIALDARVDIPKKRFDSVATVELTAIREVSSVRFDAVNFEVQSVRLVRGGRETAPGDFRNDGESIELFFDDQPVQPGESVKILITYSVTDPKSGLHFFGPSEAEPDVPLVMWSQGQPIDNRHWVPCLDHPNEMQTSEIRVTVAAGNEAISNGALISKTMNKDGTTTFHWQTEKPHAAYLMTLVVGEFYVEHDEWRGKPVTYYVPEKHKDDVRRSFGKTTAMLDLFTRLTGVEYPWEKYSQVCVEGFGGGMENTSATTMGLGTLHDERAHLDTSSDGLVAHELAHQWFGDLVTCKDWSHLWLNEGFATYMADIWAEHHLGKDEYDHAIYREMQRAIAGGKTAPVLDRRYKAPGEMFDSRSYPKGASILHMLRRRVGDQEFWSSVNHYLVTHAHTSVETADLRQAFEDRTGRSLERFFYDWTERAGAPNVSVDYQWVDDDRLARLVVKQTQDSEPFHFPLEIAFHFDEGSPTTVRSEITEREQSLYFSLHRRPTMVLVDPRQAVLMELRENKGRDLWARQLQCGPGAIDRLRAAKALGESKNEEDLKLLAQALLEERFWGVGEAIAQSLGKIGGDAPRDALLAAISIEHPKTRRAVVQQLGDLPGHDQVRDALHGLILKGDPSYRVEAAAIEAYAKLKPDNAVPFLTALLDRPSHQEQIRSAALEGLGRQADVAALDTLIEWSKPGKPRACRSAAMEGLGELAKNEKTSQEMRDRIVGLLADSLDGERPRTQRSIIAVLSDLGRHARPALPALREVAAHGDGDRLRRAASEAVDKIAGASPPDLQVQDLRDELAKLRKEADDMRERLSRLEADEEPVLEGKTH